MEIRKKQKTLAGMFLRFAVWFCVNTLLIAVGVMLLLVASSYLGVTLPANYAELQLTEHTPEIQAAGTSPDQWIPDGADYGIYSPSGEWKTGTFGEGEQEAAWSAYQEENIYVSSGNYYRFIRQNSGDICIVRYDLYMKYAWDALNSILPAPEIMSFIWIGALFILNVIFLSRHFARQLNRQLGELREITEKIGRHDLDFEAKGSEIREIDAVMTSLSQMREALKTSLMAQWDMERQKQEQLAALTHDIKTPLTVIKGNGELLSEAGLSPENQECAADILSNVSEIQQYLERIRQVLHGIRPDYEEKELSCAQMGEILRRAAIRVAAAEKIPVSFDIRELEGTLRCSPEQILRAWNNILSNGAEHTDRKRGLEVKLRLRVKEEQKYLTAAVHDYGPGFSPRDLERADQAFYSGDDSRHDRNHQGLGLAIAKRFLEEQGGMLAFYNHPEEGAEVVCWIRMDKES